MMFRMVAHNVGSLFFITSLLPLKFLVDSGIISVMVFDWVHYGTSGVKIIETKKAFLILGCSCMLVLA